MGMMPCVREWSPKGLTLSCVLAGFALCLRIDNQMLYVFEVAGVAWVFVWSLLLGVVALCLVVLVSAHDNERRRWSVGIGLVSGVGGVGFALFQGLLPGMMGAVGSGVLLGFGLTCLLRQWGRYYRSLSFQSALLNTTLSFFLASCLWFAMTCAGTPFLFYLGLLILVLCGGLPLLMSEIVRGDEIRAGLRTDDGDDPSLPLATIWQVIRTGWVAVVGLMLGFFMAGLTFWPTSDGPTSDSMWLNSIAYAIIALAAWWVVGRTRPTREGVLNMFCRVALLVAAAAMMADIVLEIVFYPVNTIIPNAMLYFGIAVCSVLGLVVLFWTAKSSEVGFSKIFSAFCVSCAASMGAGMILFPTVGNYSQVVTLCLVAAYLLAMVLDEIVLGSMRRRS